MVNSPTLCPCPVAQEMESVKDYEYIVHKSIHQVPALQWNRHIPAANILMQFENLETTEKLHSDTMEFRYVFVKKHGITIGALYFQVVMFHANQLINYFPAFHERNFFMKGLKTVTASILNNINVPLLVSGNIFMTGENGFYFNEDIDKATRAKILRTVAASIVNQSPAIKAILVSDLYEPKGEFDSAFKKCGYHELFVESDMSITLRSDWKTFDDYIMAMSSKYRIRAKKVFELCQQHGVTSKNLSTTEVALYEKRIFELYKNVMNRADFKLGELNASFFSEQKKLFPGNYHILAYFKDGEMIGFISAYVFGKKVEVHYTGMEHTASKPLHLYQHMMYDVVRMGIEAKAAKLHFGRTAPEIKSTIGAIPTPMYGYLKHRNPVFNYFLVRPYTANLKPAHYTIRSPFKG